MNSRLLLLLNKHSVSLLSEHYMEKHRHPDFLTYCSALEKNILGDSKGRTYHAGNVSLEGSSPVEKEDIIDVTQDERRKEIAF